jgi:hypothetical protein
VDLTVSVPERASRFGCMGYFPVAALTTASSFLPAGRYQAANRSAKL